MLNGMTTTRRPRKPAGPVGGAKSQTEPVSTRTLLQTRSVSPNPALGETATSDGSAAVPIDRKLVAPEKCPFCGERQLGGGNTVVYYRCGAHIWIVKTKFGLEIRGHDGMPCDGPKEPHDAH